MPSAKHQAPTRLQGSLRARRPNHIMSSPDRRRPRRRLRPLLPIVLSASSFYAGYTRSSSTAPADPDRAAVGGPRFRRGPRRAVADDDVRRGGRGPKAAGAWSYDQCRRRIANSEVAERAYARLNSSTAQAKAEAVARPWPRQRREALFSSTESASSSVSGIAAGMVRISKDELMRDFDNFGLAVLPSHPRGGGGTDTGSEVLLIYNSRGAMPIPTDSDSADSVWDHNDGRTASLQSVNVTDALRNCDALNVLFTYNPSFANVPQCHAIVGNEGYGSYVKDRWMRLPPPANTNMNTNMNMNMPHRIRLPKPNNTNGGRPNINGPKGVDHSYPLRHVPRVTTPKGADRFPLPAYQYGRAARNNQLDAGRGAVDVAVGVDPPLRDTNTNHGHRNALRTFLENFDAVSRDLKSFMERRRIPKSGRAGAAVIVLTVNRGQSDLLANFLCASRARGLDTIGDDVLVFATDEESRDLAEGLGVAAYYDEANFGVLPSGEAKTYGDDTFTSMMFAKILSVLYVSKLGFDVLFTDVDVVPFRDPLPFFRHPSYARYDVLFQHDGSPQPRYAPLSANSGFYYVRSNKKTQYLLTSVLYHGDLVRQTKSHQQVFIQLLSEHSSLFGLNVKVFDRSETEAFPGGYQFHHEHDVIRRILTGKSKPIIFHMSWTDGKKSKVPFLRQLGEWYVRDGCILDKTLEGNVTNASGVVVERCCSGEPLISCHFRDKPSKVPCSDSPLYEKNGKSFWG